MEIEMLVPTKFNVDAVQVMANVRYPDEDIEGDLGSMLSGSTLRMTIDLDTGVVRDWPAGQVASIHAKVCDEGVYELMAGGERVAAKSGYVPGFFPGEHYGDYLLLDIDGEGRIAGWRPRERDVVDTFNFGEGA